MLPLEEMQDELHNTWSPVQHLHSVMNSEALREAYAECLPILTDYATELAQNQTLYEAIKQLAEEKTFENLDRAQQQAIKNELRDFKLAGVHLDKDKQKRFAALQTRYVALTTTFENNVLDATKHWQYHTNNQEELAGIPGIIMNHALATAKAQSLDGWVFKLDFPVYQAIMSYADDAALRQTFYTAFSTRASDQGDHAGKWDNSQVMYDILAIRAEMAQLLGFDDYAQYSLATKMAESPEQVTAFLYNLAEHARPFAEKELSDLRHFAKEHFNAENLNSWDLSYYAEKYKKHLFDVSQEELRPYFPEPVVMHGLFTIVEKLYNIQIKPLNDIDTWHNDVTCYAIYRHDDLIGRLYTDLYARTDKRGGAWMDECMLHRRMINGELQLPAAYLTCNFSQPEEGKPCLMTHDEVVTVFHELGHCLHHLLTRIEYASVSGINGVPWDAVELPSQFLEHWAWEKEAIPLFSKHFETGEPLPDAMLDKLIKAQNFQAGLAMLRQAELALFDFELHLHFQPGDKTQIQTILNKVRKKVAVITPPAFNRFQHSFTHIFAGGYAAGYYSYKWAEVLSSDAFSRFEEEGIFNPNTAHDFLNHLLSQGGSDEAILQFKRFRGRKPDISHLLRHCGLEKTKR